VGLIYKIAEALADPISLINAQIDFLKSNDVRSQGDQLLDQKRRALAPARLSFTEVEGCNGDLRHFSAQL